MTSLYPLKRWLTLSPSLSIVKWCMDHLERHLDISPSLQAQSAYMNDCHYLLSWRPRQSRWSGHTPLTLKEHNHMTAVVFIYHHQVSTAADSKIMSRFAAPYRNARSPLLALVPIRPTGSLEKQRKPSSNHVFVVELKVMHTIKLFIPVLLGDRAARGFLWYRGCPWKSMRKTQKDTLFG